MDDDSADDGNDDETTIKMAFAGSPARDQVEKGRNATARKDRLTVEVRGPKWFDVKNRTERARTRERDRYKTTVVGASETEKKDARRSKR